MPRKIKTAKVKHISLVPRGANKMSVLYKDDGSVEIDTLLLKNEDEGLLTAVVYAPNMIDSHGDFAEAQTIREMAHDFLKSGEGVDILHDGKTLSKDDASVVESFIIAKGDERFLDAKDRDGNTVDVTGGWAAVIKIDNADLREKYRSGEWKGVSMGGMAVFEDVAKDDHGLIHKLIKALTQFGKADDTFTPTGEVEMTPEDLKKAVAEAVAEALAKSETPAPATPAAPAVDPKPAKVVEFDEDGKPVFKGDIADAKHRTEYKRELAKYEILSNYDLSNSEQFAQAEAELETLLKGSTAKPKSNQPETTTGDIFKADAGFDWTKLAKESAAAQYGNPAKKGA
jgi:hypothetical protein